MWAVDQTINFLFATIPFLVALLYLFKFQTRNIMLKLSLMVMLAFSAFVVKQIVPDTLISYGYYALAIFLSIAVLAK